MKKIFITLAATALCAAPAFASDHGHEKAHGSHANPCAHSTHHAAVSDKVIAEQRKRLQKAPKAKVLDHNHQEILMPFLAQTNASLVKHQHRLL